MATAVHSANDMSLDKLLFNWFDFALVLVLLLGVWRGRKHGMSEETLPLIKWLVIVLAGAALHEPVGRFLEGNTVFTLLTCFVLAYLSIMLIVFGLFSLLKHSVGGKLLGSDLFGKAEYYLGMASGLVRFTCMLIAVLALLNARLFTPAEVNAMKNFQKDVYGSEFFPTLHTAQEQVFVKSLTGPWIKKYAGALFIKPTPSEKKPLRKQQPNELF